MTALLLAIIYIAFISLGLPDSLLGSAWPVMHEDLHVALSYAGIISMIIAGGTIISSLMSEKLIQKLGTGKVMVISVAMTAVAIFGFSFSHSFMALCLWAIPYGLGAGSVDAALNNYVALHYAARHMNWLHCFWGIGAMIGPYIMGYYLNRGSNWNSGYRAIGIIQTILVIFLLFSLPLWNQKKEKNNSSEKKSHALGLKNTLGLPGAKQVFISFFSYCSFESTAALWASSYLAIYKGIKPEIAAKYAFLFYFGIASGRFICGFIANRLGDKRMVRLGQSIMVLGMILLFLPLPNIVTLIALITIGLGCAPIYPSLIHATPDNFGAENSQSVIGVQMASAYVGSTFMPPVFGWLAGKISIRLYPFYLVIFLVFLVFMTEKLNRIIANENKR